MKRKLLIILATLLISVPTMAKTQNMVVNGKSAEVTTIIEQGRSLVSMRQLCSLLNLTPSYDYKTKTIEVKANKGNRTLTMTIGSNIATLDGIEKVEMDIPPQIVNNTTYIPLRFLAETFSCGISQPVQGGVIYIAQNADSRYGFEAYNGETHSVANSSTSTSTTNGLLDGDIINLDKIENASFLYRAAQAAIKPYLKDSVTAQFDPTSKASIFKMDNGLDVVVYGKIRATNSYGAYLTSNYTVVFYDGEWNKYAIYLDNKLLARNFKR